MLPVGFRAENLSPRMRMLVVSGIHRMNIVGQSTDAGGPHRELVALGPMVKLERPSPWNLRR